jgi:hypothetical protein
MAFIVGQNPPLRSYCPATHPVQLPAISELFDWQVKTLAAPSTWRLSSDVPGRAAGLSAHADWMGAWDPSIFQIIVTRCLRAAMDCGVASIGDGRELF